MISGTRGNVGDELTDARVFGEVIDLGRGLGHIPVVPDAGTRPEVGERARCAPVLPLRGPTLRPRRPNPDAVRLWQVQQRQRVSEGIGNVGVGKGIGNVVDGNGGVKVGGGTTVDVVGG